MSLTDQEQVVLKAIYHIGRNGIAPIASVIKAVGYPKATTKKLLVKMADKGIVVLHRHDYPTSLSSAERKLLIRRQDGQGRWHYFTAVSVMKQNPKREHLRGATAKQGRRKKEVAARTVKARQNPKKTTGKGKTALKKTGKALKGFAQGALSAASQIFGAGAEALNPVRRKIRNKYIDLVIRGQAKKTPQGWRVGKKTFAQGRGTVSVSSGYYLDRATGLVYAKRERNKTKKRAKQKRNISEGFYDASGTFHPIRSATDYDSRVAGETGGQARKTRSKKKISAKRKAMASRLAGRAIKKSSGLLKRKRRNPSAEAIRKKFAGRVSGERDVFVPSSAPKGKLAKLGKLVSITTEEGTIKPVHGLAVLLADTNGKLHIGSLTNAPLFNGPARSFGQVKRIEYDDSKPHLGFKSPIIWHHKMGEETGHRPTLHADGKGGLVFRGGRYRLTSRGIEN